MVEWLNNNQGLLACGIVHGATLYQVTGKRALGIAERDTAVGAQARHVAELFAAEPASDSANRVNARLVAEHFVAVMNQFDRGRIVNRWLRVGRNAQAGDTVFDRGFRFALDIRFFRLPRIT